MEKEFSKPVIPTLGKHIIVELSGCDPNTINDIHDVENTMIDAAKEANATIIKNVFHKFSPVGVSGVVVISESHLSIHTWPELGYAAIDIYTCGNTTKPFKACYFLAKQFKAKKIKATYILRGIENKRKKFYTHKIKIIEGNINVLRVLPTKIKISKYKNGNNHNKKLFLVGGSK
ncbi:MAG: adenosylmethionine decarboxylase [Candidatus Calescibacterium sp.]|nr:adenosylmethionine decarboxylase [Candidatus Calescibacterium sp.]